MDIAALPKRNAEPLSAVIVEPALPDALLAVSALSAAWFHVTVAETFQEANALLSIRTPLLLITELQLGDYNGLHLVLHGKASRPEMAAVVTARRHDPVLHVEAQRMGATFVRKPTTEVQLMAAVVRTICRAPHDTTVIAEPLERRTHERRGPQRIERAIVERRLAERRWGLARLLGDGDRM